MFKLCHKNLSYHVTILRVFFSKAMYSAIPVYRSVRLTPVLCRNG